MLSLRLRCKLYTQMLAAPASADACPGKSSACCRLLTIVQHAEVEGAGQLRAPDPVVPPPPHRPAVQRPHLEHRVVPARMQACASPSARSGRLAGAREGTRSASRRSQRKPAASRGWPWGWAAVEQLELAGELVVCSVLPRHDPPAPLLLPCAHGSIRGPLNWHALALGQHPCQHVPSRVVCYSATWEGNLAARTAAMQHPGTLVRGTADDLLDRCGQGSNR